MKTKSIFLIIFIILTGMILTGSWDDVAAQTNHENEENPITERIREELEKVLQDEDVLGDSFELVDIVRAKESDDWPDGYCLEIRYTGEGGENLPTGEICFFQDGQTDRTELGRLDHFQFNRWSPRLEVETVGHCSRFAKYSSPGVKDENASGEYRGAYVKDAWIGDFHLPELAVEDDQFLYIDMINRILDLLPPFFSEELDSMSALETQQIILNALMEEAASLPEQYGFTGHTGYMDSWLGAEITYCFDVFAKDVEGVQLCLFRDQAMDQTSDLRLRQLREFNFWWGELLDRDILEGYDGSTLIADEYNPSVFYLLFTHDEWVGYLNLFFADQTPRYETLDILGQAILKALQNLPEDLPVKKTDLLYTDVLSGSWYTGVFPSGYHLGPVLRFDDRRDPQQYIYYQDNIGPVGEIHYYQELDYFTRLAEKSFDSSFYNNDFDGYADYKDMKNPYSELVSDPDVLQAWWTIGDGSERFIFYNLKVEGLVALIQLSDEEDISIAEDIGKAIADSVQKPESIEFYSWDDEVESSIWSCFPADDEMLLSDMMPAYVRSIQYNSEGYTYRANYFDQNQPIENTIITLRNFAYQPSRIDLGFSPITEQNPYYVFAEGNSFDESIQNYMTMIKGKSIINLASKAYDFSLVGKYFPYGWLNNSDNTYMKDNFTQLSSEMSACLADDLDIFPITVPGEVSETALDESYLREWIILTDEYTIPDMGSDAMIDSSVVPSLNLYNWRAHGIYLELYFSRELTEPLTYAIYNARYDTILYLQQNKYTLGGDHLYTRLMVERDWLFEGEHIMLIWMGDTLIGYKPFNMFADEGGY